MPRDWEDEYWTDDDWARARELADEFWHAKREGLYGYEAARAVGRVTEEREADRLATEEQWWWDFYCAIYPDLAAEGPGAVERPLAGDGRDEAQADTP